MAERRYKWREGEPDLNGMAIRCGLRNTAKHEAGHALVAWLLDRYLVGVIADPNGGLTNSIGGLSSEFSACHGILFAMAGMLCANEREVLFDLRDHVDDENYFADRTDSSTIAELVKFIDGNSFGVLLGIQGVISRIRERFGRPFNELVRMLENNDKHMVNFVQLYELYGRWDAEFGFDKRPKSDFLNRMFAREFKMVLPKCKWIGWDFKPLEGWEYKRPTLQEIAVKIKAEMDGRLNNRK